MKFVTYLDGDGNSRPGAVSKDGKYIHPLGTMGYEYRDLVDFIAVCTPAALADIGEKMERSPAPSALVLAETTLDAPIPQPRHDIICVGQNYLEHALESARYAGREYVKPKYPVYFSKRVNRAVPPEGLISAHADITEKLDYEAELAVIIGRHCDHARPEEAFEHIFGYTIVNDVSARDIQANHVQYSRGKGLDNFAPMGPWLVTRDEFRDPPHLRVQCRVNGEARQDSNTSEFIFGIPRLVSELSAGIALEPGDIIITGTPSGVGMGFQPPRFLKPGDAVECEIEGIGVLRNRVG